MDSSIKREISNQKILKGTKNTDHKKRLANGIHMVKHNVWENIESGLL